MFLQISDSIKNRTMKSHAGPRKFSYYVVDYTVHAVPLPMPTRENQQEL